MSETTEPTPQPTATPAPTYPLRQVDVEGGAPIELRSDLAIPPGCDLPKGS